MNRKSSRLYIFLLRLPIFIASHAFFSYFYSVAYKQEAFAASYLLILPFISLFIIDEAVNKKSVRVILQIVGIFIWIYAVYSTIGRPGRSYLLTPFSVICSVFLFYFLVTNPYQYESYKFTNIIGLCFFCYILLGVYLKIKSADIFFIDGVLLTILSYLCRHISRINHFIGSYACRGKSKKAIASLLSRNYSFMAASVLIISVSGFAAFISYSPSPIPAAATKDYTYAIPGSNSMPEHTIEAGAKPKSDLKPLAAGIKDITNPTETINRILIPFFIFFLLLSIFALVKINIKRRVEDADFEDFDEDINESYEFPTHKRKNIRLAELGVNRSVRRMFYKKVNEYRKKGLVVKQSHTARFISDEISQTENISALDKIYHKARYSGKELDKSELIRR